MKMVALALGIIFLLIVLSLVSFVSMKPMGIMQAENRRGPSDDISAAFEGQACSRIADQIRECPEGYFCYESIGGGIGPEGPLPVTHLGGDNKCHKLCQVDSDCTVRNPHCIGKAIVTGDASENIALCWKEDCAAQGENYYDAGKPDRCCEGLIDVYSSADGYISIADECYYTASGGSLEGGKCSDCGNGVCEAVESVCGCPEDCEGKGRFDYETVDEFCDEHWSVSNVTQTRCETWEIFVDNPICDICD